MANESPYIVVPSLGRRKSHNNTVNDTPQCSGGEQFVRQTLNVSIFTGDLMVNVELGYYYHC